jgi:hypothetical protein
MQHDAENGIDRTWRQLFGLGDEVARRVVDERIERPSRPQRVQHRIDGRRIADIAAVPGDAAWITTGHDLLQLGRCLLQHLFAPAADGKACAELQESFSHRQAKARAAAGDEDSLAAQQTRLEHRRSPHLALIAGDYLSPLIALPPLNV